MINCVALFYSSFKQSLRQTHSRLFLNPQPASEYFQLHISGLQAPYFGLRHGRKCEICPTLTLSFLSRPRAAHQAKPGSERGILEGLMGRCGPPSRTRTGLLPMVPLVDTEGLSRQRFIIIIISFIKGTAGF